MGEIIGIGDDLFDHDVAAAAIEGSGDVIHDFAYDLPNPLTYRQLLCVLTYVLEESADGLIGGEASGYGEYVVLDEGDRGVGDLGGEVPGLAFTKPKVLLGLLENHLDGLPHGVNPIGSVEVKGCVCGFLNWFNRWGGNYVLNSVIICVLVPLVIYGVLIYLLMSRT